jgi:hypothetical protein
MRRLAADDPAHRGIMTKSLGVVHILVPGQSPKHGLPQHSHQRVPSILARSRISERFASHRGKTKRVVEFPIRDQPGVRGHHRPAKLELQAAVEIDPENPIVRFTRRVGHQGASHP